MSLVEDTLRILGDSPIADKIREAAALTPSEESVVQEIAEDLPPDAKKKFSAKTPATEPRARGVRSFSAPDARPLTAEQSVAYETLVAQTGGTPRLVTPDSEGLQTLVRIAEELFGAEVRFFVGDETSGYDGVYDPDSNTVFVDATSNRAVEVVLGHEMAHVLETNAPELYNEAESALLGKTSKTRMDRYLEGAGITQNYPKSEWVREFFADVFGKSVSNPAHINRLKTILGKKNSSVWQKVGNWFSRNIRDFVGRVRAAVNAEPKGFRQPLGRGVWLF